MAVQACALPSTASPGREEEGAGDHLLLGNLRPAGELQENRLLPRQGSPQGISAKGATVEPGHREHAVGPTQVFLQVPSTLELPVLAATLGAASLFGFHLLN